MKKISNEVTAHAPIESVLAVMLRIGDYPQFVPGMDALEVLEYADDRLEFVSKMTSTSKVVPVPVVSVQRVHYDVERMEVHIRQLEGRLQHMRSLRRLTPDGDRTHIYIEVEYKIPSGVMGNLLKGVVDNTVVQNTSAMLQGFKERAEQIEPPSAGFLERVSGAKNFRELQAMAV